MSPPPIGDRRRRLLEFLPEEEEVQTGERRQRLLGFIEELESSPAASSRLVRPEDIPPAQRSPAQQATVDARAETARLQEETRRIIEGRTGEGFFTNTDFRFGNPANIPTGDFSAAILNNLLELGIETGARFENFGRGVGILSGDPMSQRELRVFRNQIQTQPQGVGEIAAEVVTGIPFGGATGPSMSVQDLDNPLMAAGVAVPPATVITAPAIQGLFQGGRALIGSRARPVPIPPAPAQQMLVRRPVSEPISVTLSRLQNTFTPSQRSFVPPSSRTEVINPLARPRSAPIDFLGDVLESGRTRIGQISDDVSFVSDDGIIHFDLLSDISQPTPQQGPLRGYRSGLGDVDIGVPGQQPITISGEGTFPLSARPVPEPSLLSDPAEQLMMQGERLVPENRIPIAGIRESLSYPLPTGTRPTPSRFNMPQSQARRPLPSSSGQVPPRTPTPSSTGIASIPEPAQINPTPVERNILGLQPHTVGLTRGERITNSLKSVLGILGRKAFAIVGRGGTDADPVVRPVMRNARQAMDNADSLANVYRSTLTRSINNAFKFSDDGTYRIPDLEGVEARRPGGPTLRTVAARLPVYREHLSPEQLEVMEQIRKSIDDPRQLYNQFPLMDDAGKVIKALPASADDILEEGGGFYIPAGGADDVTLDLPNRFTPPRGTRSGVSTAAEKPRVFTGTPDGPPNLLTQEEAIEQGWRYAHPADAVADFTSGAGRRTAKVYVNDALRPYGMTPKQIANKLNPELFQEVETLRKQYRTLTQLGVRHSKRQSDIITSFFDDPTFDDINAVFDVIDKPISRGQFAGASIQDAEMLRQAIRARLAVLRRPYNNLIKQAEGLRSLNGEALSGIPEHPMLARRKFPQAMADAASEELQQMFPGQSVLDIQRDIDGAYTLFKSTADDSHIGIQGWLMLWSNPKRWAQVFKGHWRGFFDPDAIGARIEDLNSLDMRRVTVDGVEHILPTVEELAGRANLHITGRASAGSVLRGGQASKLEKIFTAPGRVRIPGTSRRVGMNPLARFNNLFNYTGDRLRVEFMRDDIIDQLRLGRTIDDLWDSGDMARLGSAMSRDTGFASSNFGGPTGRRMMFASRWFQARLEVAANGVLGAGRDPRVLVEALPQGQRLTQASRLTINQRQSAKRFWRLIYYASAITAGINELAEYDPETAKKLGFEPNPTYLQPRVNGRFNSNFMRIRWKDRDWSLYGPYHSLYNILHLTATGRPHDSVRSLAGGTVSNLWDVVGIMTGHGDFRARSELGEAAVTKVAERVTGEEDIDPNTSKAIQMTGRMIENLTPFGSEEAYESGQTIGSGDLTGGLIGIVAEGLGIQSTALSPTDIADRIALESNLPSMDIAEPYQKRILNAYEEVEKRREGFPLTSQQTRVNQAYDRFDARVEQIVTIRGASPIQMASMYLDAEGSLFDELRGLREFENDIVDPFTAIQNGEIQSNEDAINGWYSVSNLRQSINLRTGKPGGDNLYRTRMAYLRALPEDLREYVMRNTNLRVPPDIIMRGLGGVSVNKRSLILQSQAARKRHLSSMNADESLTDKLKVLP